MARRFAWASPDYVLEMPFCWAQALLDELTPAATREAKDQTPDLKAFYLRYGRAIKRPPGGGKREPIG